MAERAPGRGVDVVRTPLLIAALSCALACGCMSTDGDVLSSLSGDASADVADASESEDGSEPFDAAVADADECADPCPAPDPGDVTICGRILDLETSLPVTASVPDVRVVDFAELRDNPLDPDWADLVTPDECGWFHTTIDAVAEWTVVHTGPIIGTGTYRRVITVVPTVSGQIITMNAFVLRADTDDAWSSDAGLPFGTFASGGAVMAIFVDVTASAVWPFQGTPVSGVTMLADGLTHANEDYYFSDSDSATRSQIDSGLVTTGPNGAALMRGTAVVSRYSGQLAGCVFSESQGLPLPSAVQVQEITGYCN